jgi:hypothetical protein
MSVTAFGTQPEVSAEVVALARLTKDNFFPGKFGSIG